MFSALRDDKGPLPRKIAMQPHQTAEQDVSMLKSTGLSYMSELSFRFTAAVV